MPKILAMAAGMYIVRAISTNKGNDMERDRLDADIEDFEARQESAFDEYDAAETLLNTPEGRTQVINKLMDEDDLRDILHDMLESSKQSGDKALARLTMRVIESGKEAALSIVQED